MSIGSSTSTPTHIAFADETNFNKGRYRGLALVTVGEEHVDLVRATLRAYLEEATMTEFKWNKLSGARERTVALNMLDCVVEHALGGRLRVDVLLWDIEDSRHKIRGRDDIANLHRMYRKLFKYVLRERWPDGSVWRLCPDTQSAMEWDGLVAFLDMASTSYSFRGDLLTGRGERPTVQQEFRIAQLEPCDSKEEPLVQLADLCAGLAAYSRISYQKYEQWVLQCSGQQRLSLFQSQQDAKLSGRDHERCRVLAAFNESCKRHKLGVSLESRRGLWTPKPENAINFLLYQPQHEADKAPLKRD